MSASLVRFDALSGLRRRSRDSSRFLACGRLSLCPLLACAAYLNLNVFHFLVDRGNLWDDVLNGLDG